MDQEAILTLNLIIKWFSKVYILLTKNQQIVNQFFFVDRLRLESQHIKIVHRPEE